MKIRNIMQRNFADFISSNKDSIKNKPLICNAFVKQLDDEMIYRICYDWADLHFNYCRGVSEGGHGPVPLLMSTTTDTDALNTIKQYIFSKVAQKLTLQTTMPDGRQFGGWTRTDGATKGALMGAAYIVTQTLTAGEQVSDVYTNATLAQFLRDCEQASSGAAMPTPTRHNSPSQPKHKHENERQPRP